ncbi:hypothetical protein [Amycolatopsis kentuckyensis]|uniref:hypothetical protein n=1 Tax=Amycolatopsis kentuckyensis TaxID=218823 RepID=UPI0035675C3A
MYETLTLLSALVSAVAAVVGSWVAVAQWRASRPKPPVAAARTPAPPSVPVAARPPGRGLARAAAVAVTLGTVTAVCSGLGDVVFGLQQQDSTSGQESLLSFLLGAAVLAGLAATLLGLVLIAAGLGKRQRRLVRLGLLAVVLSQTFWPATWLTTFL